MKHSTRIRVMLVDDHIVVREGLVSMLSANDDIEIVGQATNGADAIKKAKELLPDVILLDIRLPGVSGWEVCRILLEEVPEMRIVMLTSFDDDDYLLKALRVGAMGYLLKTASPEEILSTVRSVAQGQRLLSAPMVDKLVSEYTKLAREMEKQGTGMDEDEIEILKQLALGATNAEIASKTSWSLVSIKRKLQVIFDKLGVDDRTSAAVEAVRRGLI